MIALAFATAVLGQQLSCEQMLAPSSDESSMMLTGFVGRDLTHNYIWISDFGCGPEQQVLLFFREEDLNRTPGGRTAIDAINDADLRAIREGRMHVPNTGLRVRTVGRIAPETTLRQLNVEALELLESPR